MASTDSKKATVKTGSETKFARELFDLVKSRVDAEGLGSTEKMAQALGEHESEVSGYVSALREDRPWCIGTSVYLAARLGWELLIEWGGEE